MNPLNIVFLDRGTIGPGVRLRRPAFGHRWTEHERTAPIEVRDRLADAEIAITNKVPITAQTLEELPDLRLVAIAATGTNIVDLAACRARGIVVCNIQGYAATTVSEHTLAVILGLRRNLFQYRSEVIAGAWQAARQFCYFNRPIHDLAGATLGILGTGAIAASVGRLGACFGMRVVHHSLSGRTAVDGMVLVDADRLFAEADVVSLHCPLTERSAGFVDATRLAQMKADALLINTARGEIVILEDLEDALLRGRIGGAAFDVAPLEPPPADSPLMRLASRSDFLLTPHTGWASVEAMQVLADQLIDNLDAFAAGRPIHVVT